MLGFFGHLNEFVLKILRYNGEHIEYDFDIMSGSEELLMLNNQQESFGTFPNEESLHVRRIFRLFKASIFFRLFGLRNSRLLPAYEMF